FQYGYSSQITKIVINYCIQFNSYSKDLRKMKASMTMSKEEIGTFYFPIISERKLALFEVILDVVLAVMGDNIAYQHGLHFCEEVYPSRNRKKV
ncbi:MAG: hypothetical protein ACRD8Z_21735, partial [Nitrososphaeraceae archaeon]